MLDLLGLVATLEWKVQKFRKLSKIACKSVILLPEKEVDRTVSTAIFRIVQEALSNVEHHSGATLVELNLVEKKGVLMLSVRDNGRGIQANEKNGLFSLGIASIRERARSLGGKMRIFGSPLRGTALFVRIPLSGKEN
jgi:signal transduction histidine kinase